MLAGHSRAIVVTDLAEAAEVNISAALGHKLTINQINSAGGSDTLTVDFSGATYTTGGSIIAPNIETVTPRMIIKIADLKNSEPDRWKEMANIKFGA